MARQIWENVRRYPSWDHAQAAFKERVNGFTVWRANRLFGKRTDEERDVEISESTKQRVSSLLNHVLKEHQNTKYGVQDALVRVGWHELINRYLLLILVPGEKEQILTTNQDNNHNSLRNVQREALIDLAFAAVEQYHAKFEFMGDSPKPLPKDGWRPKKPERTRW